MTTFLKRIITGAKLGGKLPLQSVNVGRPGDPEQLVIYKGRIFVYNAQGQALVDGGIISANAILAGTIEASRLSIGYKKFAHSIEFTAYDEDTAIWSGGTIKFADGTSQYINPGNSGNLTEKTYLYYNGSANLQKTTREDTAISSM